MVVVCAWDEQEKRGKRKEGQRLFNESDETIPKSMNFFNNKVCEGDERTRITRRRRRHREKSNIRISRMNDR